MSHVEAWIRARFPLEADAERRMARELSLRAAMRGIDVGEYLDQLDSEPAEVDASLEIAVPGETWLFRHVEAYEQLRGWMAEAGTRPLRLASLGCAGGAEPQSMAATAASVGRDAHDTAISAVDWNASLLRAGASGRVTASARRTPIPAWADAWFTPEPDGGLRLAAEPLSMIEWKRVDVLDARELGVFDAVMCRNMAIYLDGGARERLRQVLETCVRPGGLLFLGHADPSSLHSGAFRRVARPGAFAFERLDSGVDVGPGKPGSPASPAGSAVAEDPFAEARRLLAACDPQAASNAIRATLASRPMEVEGWWLLAVACLSLREETEASRCVDRVLYLDPMHVLALLQAATTAQRQGDVEAADRLRERARRARESGR